MSQIPLLDHQYHMYYKVVGYTTTHPNATIWYLPQAMTIPQSRSDWSKAKFRQSSQPQYRICSRVWDRFGETCSRMAESECRRHKIPCLGIPFVPYPTACNRCCYRKMHWALMPGTQGSRQNDAPAKVQAAEYTQRKFPLRLVLGYMEAPRGARWEEDSARCFRGSAYRTRLIRRPNYWYPGFRDLAPRKSRRTESAGGIRLVRNRGCCEENQCWWPAYWG